MTKTELAKLSNSDKEMELVIPVHGIHVNEDVMTAYDAVGDVMWYSLERINERHISVREKNACASLGAVAQEQQKMSVGKEADEKDVEKLKKWARDAQRLDKEFWKKVGEDIRKADGVRSFNVGESDYSKHTIQPWDIWREYHLDPWTADIVKRALRTKKVEGMTKQESRKQDLQKIKHICDELINQIDEGYVF